MSDDFEQYKRTAPSGGQDEFAQYKKQSATVLRESGEEVPNGGFGMGHYLMNSVPSGGQLLHALGMPASKDEAQRQSDEMMSHPARTVFSQIKPILMPGGMGTQTLMSMGKEGYRGVKGMLSGDPNAGIHMAATLNPFAAPAIDAMSEQGLGTPEANATGIAQAAPMILGELVPRVAPPITRAGIKIANKAISPRAIGASGGAFFGPIGAAAGAEALPEMFPAWDAKAKAGIIPTPRWAAKPARMSPAPSLNDAPAASASPLDKPVVESGSGDARMGERGTYMRDPRTGKEILESAKEKLGVGQGTVAMQEGVKAETPAEDTIPRTASGELVLNKAITKLDKPSLLRIARARGIDTTQEANLIPSKAEASLVKKINASLTPDEIDEAREMGLELSRNPVGDSVGPEAWHYKVLRQFFHDVEIPKAMAKRAEASIAKRPARMGEPKETMPQESDEMSDSSDLIKGLQQMKKAKK